MPKNYRIALSIRGRDYVYPGGSGGRLSNMKNEFTGNGPFLHDDPRDRPLEIYGGKTTIYLGGGKDNYVLLPIIPHAASANTRKPKRARRRKRSRSPTEKRGDRQRACFDLGVIDVDALGYRKKIGIVVPSTNTVVGPESEALRPPGVTNYVARLTIQDRPIRSPAIRDICLTSRRCGTASDRRLIKS